MNTKKKKELTADDVWVMLAELTKKQTETNEQMKKTDEQMKKTDELLKELCAAGSKTDELLKELCAAGSKTDELLKELCAAGSKTDERLEKLCGKVGGMDENLGHHAEQFFQDSFAQTLAFGGVKYDRIRPNLSDSDKSGGVEFDIVLINGKCVAIIEVKNRIHPKFVKELTTEKLNKFRKHFPEYKNHKVYLGVAGFSFCDKVLKEAKKYGVGIIKQVGQCIEVEADKLKAY